MKYTLEEEIIHFVFLAFANKKRKKENIELSFHSIMVGNMLKNINCKDEIVYIGYLHDIIEDTDYDYKFLKEKYGLKIADGVKMLSENKSIDNYIERKRDFIEKLKNVDKDTILVEIADKLQNLISDYDMYSKKGRNFLVKEANNYNELKWYYLELKKIFNSKLEGNILLDRYNEITKENFNI